MVSTNLVHRKRSVKVSWWYGVEKNMGPWAPLDLLCAGHAVVPWGYDGEQKHCPDLIKFIVWRDSGTSKQITTRRAK